SANIIVEDQAKTTIENITYAKELIPEEASVTIVTNRFHAWRASLIAKKYGLENFQTVPADTYQPFAPYYYMREACVIVKDMSKGLL
ncbi:MAG: YdcF family protein, partial [Anaerovoracaceae bacterium]